MLYIGETALALLAAWTAWVMVRCRVGFHGRTLAEQVYEDGARVRYRMQFRCERCLRVASAVEIRPTLSTFVQLRKQRQAARVLQMPERKRA
jgi:hypothetical protein